MTAPVSVLAEVGAWAEENVPGVFPDSYVAKENQVVRRTSSHNDEGASLLQLPSGDDGLVVSM